MIPPHSQASESTVTKGGVRFCSPEPFGPSFQNTSDESPDRPNSSNETNMDRSSDNVQKAKKEAARSTDRNFVRRGVEHSIPYLSSVEHTKTETQSRLVIFASSAPRYYWDVLIFFLMMYVALVSIFVFSFTYTISYRPIWFALERVLDAIFFVDIILNFFTSYKVERFDDAPVTLKQTSFKYLSSFFFPDLISTIPWDAVSDTLASNDQSLVYLLRYLRLLRIVKLPRLGRALRVRESFTHIEVKFNIKYGHMKLFTLVFSVVIIAHWFACLFHFFGTFPDSANPGFFTDDDESLPSQTFGRYIISLYFSIYTITTIGYGDVAPTNTLERTYVNVIMFLGAACFAYVISQVSNIFGELHENFALRRRMMDMLTDLTRIQKIPPALAVEIRQYFHDYFSHKRVTDEKALLDVMSNGLRQRVLRHMYGQYVRSTGILNAIPDHKLNDVYCNIREQFKHKEDVLFNVGDLADGLYIVKNGLVTLIDETGDTAQVGDGAVIGVADMPIRRGWKYKAVVLVNSVILQIPRTFIVEALENRHDSLCALRDVEAGQLWRQALQVLQRNMRLVQLSNRFKNRTKEWLRESGQITDAIETEDAEDDVEGTGEATTEAEDDADDAGSASRTRRGSQEGDDENIEKLQRELREKKRRVEQLAGQILQLRQNMQSLLSDLDSMSESL